RRTHVPDLWTRTVSRLVIRWRRQTRHTRNDPVAQLPQCNTHGRGQRARASAARGNPDLLIHRPRGLGVGCPDCPDRAENHIARGIAVELVNIDRHRVLPAGNGGWNPSTHVIRQYTPDRLVQWRGPAIQPRDAELVRPDPSYQLGAIQLARDRN